MTGPADAGPPHRRSPFPRLKRLPDFNTGLIPGIAAQLATLATGAWIDAGEPVAAIVDRVTFSAHIIETGTQSYRLATSKTSTQRNALADPNQPAGAVAAGGLVLGC